MRHERKASLLFLICLLLYLALSGVMSLIVGVVYMVDPSAKIDDLTYLLNALMVSLPAFFIPAVIFRRVTKMPAFKAPRFTHILLAVGIGIGCLLLNQSLTSFLGAVFYNADLNSLSTTSESVTDLNDFNMIFSLAIIPPLSEEFLMRGTLLESWRKASPIGAILLTSILFALLHSAPTAIPVYFAIGMLLAGVYMITRNVWLTVTVHLINNLGSVVGALIIKHGGDMIDQAESAMPGGMEGLFSLLLMAFVYALAAGAFLVPLMLGLNAVYKKKKLGRYSEATIPEPAAEEPALAVSAAEEPAAIESIAAEPVKKVSLLADPFLWIAIAILLALNLFSGLIEFGVVQLPGTM